MTIVDALNVLYEKLGGTEPFDGVDVVSEAINKISDVVSGGSDSGAFVVSATSTLNVDKSYQEVVNAVNDGKSVWLKLYSGEMVRIAGVLPNANYVFFVGWEVIASPSGTTGVYWDQFVLGKNATKLTQTKKQITFAS